MELRPKPKSIVLRLCYWPHLRFWLGSMVVATCLLACSRPQPTALPAPSFQIGLIADAQYADKDDSGQRKFRLSEQKLTKAVQGLNREQPDLVFHVGDFIDADWKSFDVVEPIMNRLSMPYYHVLGNHDFFVKDDLKLQVPQRMGLPQRYDVLLHKGWRFILLDGNDISLHAWPKSSDQHQMSLDWKKQFAPEGKNWNGAIGETQLNWLREQLQLAQEAQQPVIIFCHFPVYPFTNHELWNRETVLKLLDESGQVRVWIAGHHHAGSYAYRNGVHHLTLHGMLDSTETAWSLLEFTPTALRLTGFGRQSDYQLDLSD